MLTLLLDLHHLSFEFWKLVRKKAGEEVCQILGGQFHAHFLDEETEVSVTCPIGDSGGWTAGFRSLNSLWFCWLNCSALFDFSHKPWNSTQFCSSLPGYSNPGCLIQGDTALMEFSLTCHCSGPSSRVWHQPKSHVQIVSPTELGRLRFLFS